MALYHKYRPKKFAQVVGQEHVVQTLQGALKTGQLAHAYLFAGPRGTGKTTLARLLAKVVNCADLSKISESEGGLDACGVCQFCREIEEGKSLDLIEIDAASNRGIDEIRALREGTRFASMNAGKHKVYVIDECHQLTKEAFNALLKTLEEPPAKTLFILATTEPAKVLSTITSRVQRFDLKKLSSEQITGKLNHIAAAEKVKINKDLLKIIALSADGSLRDAESSFAKLIAYTVPTGPLRAPSARAASATCDQSFSEASRQEGLEIDEAAVREILGIIPLNVFGQFFDLILAKKRGEAVALVSHIYESGLDLEIFIKGLLDYTRRILIAKADPAVVINYRREIGDETAQRISAAAQAMESGTVLKLLNVLLKAQQEMKISPIPQLPLEIAVTELTE